jgi:predicted nucleotidyltransferase
MDPLIEEHREEILELVRRHRVCHVRLFGSMAHGTATADSDADFLVDLGETASAFDLGALLMDLQELLGRRVDVVTESALHPSLKECVLREAIPL